MKKDLPQSRRDALELMMCANEKYYAEADNCALLIISGAGESGAGGDMFSKRSVVSRLVRRCYASRSGALSGDELRRLHAQLEGPRTVLVLPDENCAANRTRRSLTLLVGWVSSPLRTVAKYARPYAKIGIPTVCVAPNEFEVWITALGLKRTRFLLRTMDGSLDKPVSLILHMLSRGPCVVLPGIAADFESSERELTRKLHPACVVFDSGPASFSYESGMAAARLMYEQGGYNYPTYLASVSCEIMLNAVAGRRKREERNRALRSPLLDIPQLYLYSEADTVWPPSLVQKVMLDQQAVGREVMSHCWKESQHVHHYLSDPVTYEQCVHTLLKRCQLL